MYHILTPFSPAACPGLSAGRGTGVISVAGARPVVPASYVPEDLVAQAQTVLQGKSRNLIIRELQVGQDVYEYTNTNGTYYTNDMYTSCYDFSVLYLRCDRLLCSSVPIYGKTLGTILTWT